MNIIKKSIHFIAWFILSVTLLCAVLWVFRLPVAAFVVPKIAQSAGLHVTEFTPSGLSLSRLQIQRLTFTQGISPDQKTVDAREVDASYRLSFSTRPPIQLVGLDIESVTIHPLSPPTEDNPESTDLQDPPPVTGKVEPEDLEEKNERIHIEEVMKTIATGLELAFPVRKIQIRELNYIDSGGATSRPLTFPTITLLAQLEAGSDQQAPVISFKASDGFTDIDAQLSGHQINAIVSRSTDGTSKSLIRMNADIQKDQITGAMAFNTQDTSKWWSHYGVPLAEESMANADVAMEFAMTQMEEHWNLKLGIGSPKFDALGFSMSNFLSQLNLELPNSIVKNKPYVIKVKPESTLNAQNIGSSGFKLDRVEFRPQGQVTILGQSRTVQLSKQSTLRFEALQAFDDQTAPLSVVRESIARTPIVKVKNLTAKPILNWHQSNEGLDIVLREESEIELESIEVNNAQMDFRQLSVIKPSQITITADGQWELLNGKWEIAQPSGELINQDTHFAARRLTANIQHIRPESTDIRLIARSLNIMTGGHSELEADHHQAQSATAPKKNQRLDYVNSQINIDNQIIRAWTSFKLDNLPNRFDLSGRYNFSTDAGRYRFRTDTPLQIKEGNGFDELINEWITQSKENTGLTNGEIDLNISGQWAKQNAHQLNVSGQLTDVSGHYNAMYFSGLNVKGGFSYPTPKKQDSISASLDKLNFGIDTNNLTLSLSFPTGVAQSAQSNQPTQSPNKTEQNDDANFNADNITFPTVSVDQFSGNIFAGKFSVKPFIYDQHKPNTALTVLASELDIEQILATQNINGLNVSGKLEGVLPIEINESGVQIDSGRFNTPADQGGVIRYEIDPNSAAALNNPLTDTVILALQEFHYHVLTADVDYEPQGQLYIDFHLEGKSPKLSTERPVHFNVNSEQNVLSLLQSLQYANQLNEAADRKFGN